MDKDKEKTPTDEENVTKDIGHEKIEIESIHTHPTNDLVEHTLSADCVCGPLKEIVIGPSGNSGVHIIHNALDGRE